MIKKTFLTAILLSTFNFLPIQGGVEAAELLSGVEVRIGPDEVLNEDVYAFAGQIVVDGTINGDLVAAGENIEINGTVSGDLIVAGRAVTVTGIIDDDIRAAAGTLQFHSLIGGDLIIAGDEIRIEADSVIGEDLVASTNTLIAKGEVAGNVDLSAFEARIEGTVRGNVDAKIEEQLILGPESLIAGELNYTSLNDVSLQTGAQVVGDITQQLPMISILGNEYQVSALILGVKQLITQSKWFLGTVIVGLVLLWLFPTTLQKVNDCLSTSPWKSLGAGVIILFLTPIALLILMIVVLSITGFSAFPIVAVPAMAYTSMLLLAKPTIAISIGSYCIHRLSRRKNFTPGTALIVGAAILAGIGLIPYIESIVAWLTLILGLGMWLLYIYRQYSQARVNHCA